MVAIVFFQVGLLSPSCVNSHQHNNNNNNNNNLHWQQIHNYRYFVATEERQQMRSWPMTRSWDSRPHSALYHVM